MSRDLFDDLSDPDAAAQHGTAAAWLAQLAAAAAALRAWKADGLAEAELRDGLWADGGDDLGEDDQLTVLAAEDSPQRAFPVRYRGGGWQVLIGCFEDGTPYALLEGGPDDRAALTVEGAAHDLTRGAEVPLPALEAPPGALSLTDEGGDTHTLAPAG